MAFDARTKFESIILFNFLISRVNIVVSSFLLLPAIMLMVFGYHNMLKDLNLKD